MNKHTIIVGCGRVGSTVAMALEDRGHDVVVIDKNPGAFKRLRPTFRGSRIVGIGFDREILTQAGITPRSAVVAVTNGDNSNVLVTRVARELFGVERTVARIYDPKRAEIYGRLGITTVPTVAWASRRVLQCVETYETNVEWTDPTATQGLGEIVVAPGTAGSKIDDIETTGIRVLLLTRNGQAREPSNEDLLQEGDRLHVFGDIGAIRTLDHLRDDDEGTHP